MATKKAAKGKEVEIQDLTDNEFGHKILDAKDEMDVLKKFVDGAKVEAFSRIDDHGAQEGKSFVIRDGDIMLKKEVRTTINVKNEEAAKLLRSKKLDNKVEVTATIEIKRGVDAASIPERLRKEIDKYFEITLHNSVNKDVLLALKEANTITETQYNKCVEEKKVEAFKVERI